MRRAAIKSFARLMGVFGLCLGVVVFGQFNDWKGQKLEAKLKRKRPPEYYVMGTEVGLKVGTQIPAGRDYVGTLQARLESNLFAQDSRLKPATGKAETIIFCEITRLDADEDRWETRTTTEHQKTGERQEWNREKGKYETKNVYGDVKVTRRYKIVKGGINISYQARDARNNATLDAQNIHSEFSKEYLDGNGSPSAHELREALVNLAIEKLTLRLVPTTETLTVFLPRGKVENFSKLGQAGLWEKMREGIDKMGTLPKSSDEAYRQFGLGIANEALAYQAEKIEDSIKLFEEASISYNKALELKADEKYFRDPMARIEQSLAQYKKLSSQQAAYAQAKSVPKATAPPAESGAKGIKTPVPSPAQQPAAAAPSGPPPSAAALTNQKVIEMVAAELDEAGIIATINSAQAVQFDLSPDGQIELRKNKVPNNVITAMRLKQNKPGATPRRTGAPSRRKP